jgi:hypothetical protein
MHAGQEFKRCQNARVWMVVSPLELIVGKHRAGHRRRAQVVMLP